jgi:hypothetical protein
LYILKQVIVDIPDNKYPFFMELVKNLGLKNVSPTNKGGKIEIRAGIIEAVEEIKLVKAGKKKARNAEDFLNGL